MFNFNQAPKTNESSNEGLKNVAAAGVIATAGLAHAGEVYTTEASPLTPEEVSFQAQETGAIALNTRFYDKNGQGYEIKLDENGAPAIFRFVVPKSEHVTVDPATQNTTVDPTSKHITVNPVSRSGESDPDELK
jgi:hypothetical protein